MAECIIARGGGGRGGGGTWTYSNTGGQGDMV